RQRVHHRERAHLPRIAKVPRRHRRRRQRGAGHARGDPPRPRAPRRHDARHRRLGGGPHDQGPPRVLRHPRRDAHRAQRLHRQAARPARRRGRLHRQAHASRGPGPQGRAQPRGRPAVRVKVLARVRDAAVRQAVADAAAMLDAEIVYADPEARDLAPEASAASADVIFVELREGEEVARHREDAHALGVGLVVACHSREECTDAALGDADEWVLLPTPADRLAPRLAVAAERVRAAPPPREEDGAAALVRYHEALHDAATGLPALPILIPRIEGWLEADGELTLRYLHFVWYARIERTYGAGRLDEVIGTAADAVREFFAREQTKEHVLTLDHAGDEDF